MASPRRRVGLRWLLSATLLTMGVVTLALGLLWWTGGIQTRAERERSIGLALTGLELRRQELARLAAAHAAWLLELEQSESAPVAASTVFDWARIHAGVDGALVIDGHQHVLQGEGSPSGAGLPAGDRVRSGLGRLVSIAKAEPDADPPSGYLEVDGLPAMVAVARLDGRDQTAARFLVYALALDEALLDDLAALYPLPGLRLRAWDEDGDDTSLTSGLMQLDLPLHAVDGEPLARLVWQLAPQGRQMVARVGPPLCLAVAGLLLLTGLLLADGREIERLLRDSRERAMEDPLTLLPNRRLFVDRLAQELGRVQRAGGLLSVLFIDLDGFKRLNDRLGHEAGDRVLIKVAGRLRRIVRNTDTLVRLGGDEFAILQVGIKSPAEAAILANRLVVSLQEPFPLGRERAEIGASIGIALAPGDTIDSGHLLRAADKALYRAKAAGGGTFRFFASQQMPSAPGEATPVVVS